MNQEMEEILKRMRTNVESSVSLDDKKCKLCNGSGWMLVKDGDYEYAKECECGLLLKRHQDNMLSFANIPISFKDNRIENFSTDVYKNNESINGIMKVARYYIDEYKDIQEKGMGLYLYSGTKGSGKTRLISSIANELIDKDIRVKFSTSVEIINAIKSTWDDKRSPQAENETDLLKALQDAEVLIVDDFGTEKVKDWMLERWYSIINKRYVDKKITMFTSNMSLEDLQYDSRITNRIKERTYQIHFPEESVRDLIAKKQHKELLGVIKC